ncbi:glycosyltransferase family 4 protein, partial [Vibrio breoganii]
INTKLIECVDNCKVTYLNYNSILSLFCAPFFLWNYKKKQEIKVIQSFGLRCDIISLLVPNIFKIVVVRNLTKINWSARGWWGKVLGSLHLSLIKRFDRVVACSDGVKAHLYKYGVNSCVINNSVEFDSSEVNSKFGTNSFVTVSSAIPGKNIEFLLEVFSSKSFFKNRILNIIGFVSDDMKDKYAMFDNIKFHGFVNKPKELYNMNDVFISASYHEGLPNAVLESLSVGTPVVLSNIVSHSSIIGSDNIVGTIFKNNDDQSLQRAINQLESNSCSRYDNNFVEILNKKFNPKLMAKEFSKIYRKGNS